MSDHHPTNEAQAQVLTAIRNEDYKAWQSILDKAGITALTADRDFAIAVYETVLMRVLGNLAFDVHEQSELEHVRMAFGLSEEEAAAVRRKRARKAIRALAKHLNTDGILTPAEHAELEALGSELTLSRDEVQAIIEEVTKEAKA